MKNLFVIQHAVILFALYLITGDSSIPGTTNLQTNCSNLEPGQKGFLQLAKVEEPGEPLVIYGRVIDRQNNQPVSDASLFLYQTDSTGIYGPPGRPEEQARIRGTINTNESGCFKIQTILPGDYPGRKNSRHLHYVINANGFKQLTSILFFKGFTTEDSGTPFSILEIKKENNGAWIGTTDLFIERSDSKTQ